MTKHKITKEVHVFIDVSNIRAACLKTLGLKIDFYHFIKYLKNKYPTLGTARYYEGIADGDNVKLAQFKRLSKIGYTICSLERKTYTSSTQYKQVKCPKCSHQWRTQVLRQTKKLKSNIDVYLTNDFLEVAHFASKPTLLVLVSCDGDYAEMIKGAIKSNKFVSVIVLATPFAKRLSNNSMSTRLTKLFKTIPRFDIANIGNIPDLIQ